MSSLIIVNLPVPYAAALAVVMLVALCAAAAGQAFAGREKLRAQSHEFRQEVIRVTDGVYVAVGYSASNVTLLQGDGGSIIVDTASDPVEAREVRAAFGTLLAAPVRAIIYTHGHPDHTGGAALAVVVYRGITLPTPEIPTRLAEQALPSEQVERQPLSTRQAEQASPRDQRERRP